MNIYILTEITKRELDPNILLALTAAQKGYTVFISNMDTIEYLSSKKLITNGIFHTKSLVHDQRKQNLHINLYNLGFKITSVDEENGLVEKKLDNFCAIRFSQKSLKFAHKIFCWGRDDYNNLIRVYKNHKKKFIKSGAPRIDLWKKKFMPYWLSTRKKQKKILVSLNFQLINGFESFEKKIQKLEFAGYFKRSAFYKKEVIEMSNQYKRDIINFKILINFLCDKLKDVLFIVRPHPVEKVSTWKKMLKTRDNLVINNDGNFNSVLADSDLLIQCGCTTAFQAAMYDIPIISYSVNHKLKSHGVVANKLGYKISSKEDAKKKIKNFFLKKQSFKVNNSKVLKKKLFIFRNKLSSSKIVEEWKKISLEKKNKTNNWTKIKLRLLFFDLKNFLKRDDKFEKFSENEILHRIYKLKKILNIQDKFDVIKVSQKSFIIKKK